MKIFNNVSLHSIYTRIVFAALMAHISFAVIFVILKIIPMVYYNLFSIMFYVITLFFINKKMYRLSVVAVHVEVCLFVTVTTLYLGWEQGFTFYLIALCALVYFCPFRNVYIPYLFSFGEIVLFIFLKIYSANHESYVIGSTVISTSLYCYNACAGFIIILYSAFITRLSSLLMNRELMEENSTLQKIVDHDTLTQLNSRGYIENQLSQIDFHQESVCIAMADIDDFKQINDTYGHPCGDYVLFTLSTIMKTLCPSGTDIGRWGGEEFILIFYEKTPAQVAGILESVRSAIQNYVFSYENNLIRLTLTFGLGSCLECQDAVELIRISDRRLYYGKQNGKNRIIVSDLS